MEWQPIETAPKDGTLILVWARWDWDGMERDRCEEDYAAQIAAWHSDVYYDEDVGNWSGAFKSESFNPYEDHAVNPTHWMPLPAPPHEQEG